MGPHGFLGEREDVRQGQGSWAERFTSVWTFHAETIAVATSDEGRDGEVRFHETIANTADSVLRLTKRLAATDRTPAGKRYLPRIVEQD